ncbi:S8 family serine peptidase [Streptomyces sp. NPDC001978]|uniref:S8 family peptidase n=1 Tax=Streptomyces sp. NPDC001978 TaxID=3364627 RepID=UPI0036C6C9B3
MKPQHHRTVLGGAAVAISMLLVTATASTSLALADPNITAASPIPVPTSMPGSKAPADGVQRWIPLITGDQVAVNAKGGVASVRPAKGREDIPLFTDTVRGHTYAVPADAQSLVQSGRLDRRLFDITTLSSPAYAQRHDLRVIVRYESARPEARTALRADALKQHTLASINADAVTEPADGTAQLWSTLTNGSADATSRTTAPGIASVWLDAVVKPSLDVSVPQIGGPQAWQAGFDGTGTRIAVLDTGIDTTHPDLAGKVVAEHNFTNSADSSDHFGHGTHVASIAAGTGAKSDGKYKGVAPGASLLNGKVLDDTGSGDTSGIIAGMEWAVAEKANVVNLSLGASDEAGIDPLEEAVNRLSAETGTLFVVAAGNNGDQGPGTISTPGSADAALTVGAVDKQDHLASFSSTGPRVGDSGIKPDLTAPGVDIAAAEAKDSLLAGVATHVADGYMSLSGTSMATPHVAGAAAILAQQHPEWDGSDIKQALTASTAPGAYTAFQQGTGRVDIGAAIKQTVIARQTSLAFGVAQWPHTDDQPMTKDLTYRNLGSTPVTLNLTTDVIGPDGTPAPSGMVTVDAQVTIAAHSEETVHVTADTRMGGDTTGVFSGRVTATGDGQTVRTALAVEREAERYTLTVKALDRTGKPAPAPSWFAQLVGLSGIGEGSYSVLDDNAYSLRVPKGRYFLSGLIKVDPAGSYSQGTDWINQPRLDISQDTTVTLDARTAKPIDVTVPDSSAHQTTGYITVDTKTASGFGEGFGFFARSFEKFRTAHLGPQVDLQEQPLDQELSLSFSTGATGNDDYYTMYQPKSDTVLTGFTDHTERREFADVAVQFGAPAKNKFGYVTPVTTSGVAGLGTLRALPYTGTIHLLSSNPTWLLPFSQVNARGSRDTSYQAPERTFMPGRSYREVFNVGVFGPDLPTGAGLVRNGEALDGSVPLFSDGNGRYNNNNSSYDEARTAIYRNGELVKATPFPMDFFYIASDERADYRLTASIDRHSVADVSTKVTASWTFSSEFAPGITRLPASVVRFTPELSLDNTAIAKATMKVPVSVKGSAADGNLKSLSVWVSYDGGDHWDELTVHNGSVLVTNPSAGGSVSFKATAVDGQGNTVDETIYNAYLTS